MLTNNRRIQERPNGNSACVTVVSSYATDPPLPKGMLCHLQPCTLDEGDRLGHRSALSCAIRRLPRCVLVGTHGCITVQTLRPAPVRDDGKRDPPAEKGLSTPLITVMQI